ncbi:alpha/beta-hydrolase [Nadsonia fulvescens var. elongata DSM 6958]|uniref:Alpha/beta-hydrolase n=1 Tax=Nadsonia fulvescens var. elongata DSM 6958 TaxID=857566 RepID=A0A1E3PFT4_9ASCO|nr:alpha/beta-hydrolase [Nadsonia fulvescens var. elongata DSM 6958]
MAELEESTLQIPVTGTSSVVGTLTLPFETNATNPPRLVIICHGSGGHRNYCYHKLLSRELATVYGYFVFRFDFRGCGESDDHFVTAYNEESRPVSGEGALGRTLDHDAQDIDAVVNHFTCNRDNGEKYIIESIVGHSRGFLAVLHFYGERFAHEPLFKIPFLINCSSRFQSHMLAEKRDREYPGWRDKGGYGTQIARYNSYVSTFIPANEVLDLSARNVQNMIARIPKLTHILSIYGSNDTVVSLEDMGHFANAFGDRHTLIVIPDADHNFYGTADSRSGSPSSVPSPTPILSPLSTPKSPVRLNYNPLVVQQIINWIRPEIVCERFNRRHEFIGFIPRWKEISGIHNFRDLGGWPIANLGFVKPGLIYRCADPQNIQPAGRNAMIQLGIRTIFDLRSDTELARSGFREIEGIERFHVPVFRTRDISPEALAQRYQKYFDSKHGFREVYREILTSGVDSYRAIMASLLKHPGEGVVIHCTAGKDRTGVICALILLFLGVDEDTVAREYELTTIGLRHFKKEFIKSFKARESALAIDEDGINNMLSSKYESMLQSIKIINEEFGGAYNYFKNQCGFTDEELQTISRNLVVNTL